jgi:hypothetical protein
MSINHAKEQKTRLLNCCWQCSLHNHKRSENPLYGCAVFGEYWYFMVLDDKTYCVSTGIISTNKEGLQRILLILRKFKHILHTELAV